MNFRKRKATMTKFRKFRLKNNVKKRKLTSDFFISVNFVQLTKKLKMKKKYIQTLGA